MEQLTFTGPLWRWTGSNNGAWFFVQIAGPAAETLSATALMRRLEGLGRGWGSLRVRVTVGDSRWETSVFPQKENGGENTWLLPVKQAVRRAEGLAENDAVDVLLEF